MKKYRVTVFQEKRISVKLLRKLIWGCQTWFKHGECGWIRMWEKALLRRGEEARASKSYPSAVGGLSVFKPSTSLL